MTNNHCVAPYCINPKLKQDLLSMFVSNYLVFRQEISQCAILVTAVTSSGRFETSQMSERSPQIESCIAPLSTIVRRGSIRNFSLIKSIVPRISLAYTHPVHFMTLTCLITNLKLSIYSIIIEVIKLTLFCTDSVWKWIPLLFTSSKS